ncbi:MAG: hypothetical protein ACKVQS_13915 [Fimbriimonadaceae bacterium]
MEFILQISPYLIWVPGVVALVLWLRAMFGLGLVKEWVLLVSMAGIAGIGINGYFFGWGVPLLIPIGLLIAWLSIPLAVIVLGLSFFGRVEGGSKRDGWLCLGFGGFLTAVCYLLQIVGVGMIANS